MSIAADYPFLDVFWTMMVFFIWVAWLMLLFRVIGDIFSRKNMGAFSKVLWLIFVIALPFLGIFVYLIANGSAMSHRSASRARAQQQEFDDHVRSAAGSSGAAGEIEKANQLLNSGAITQDEYDAIKQKALA